MTHDGPESSDDVRSALDVLEIASEGRRGRQWQSKMKPRAVTSPEDSRWLYAHIRCPPEEEIDVDDMLRKVQRAGRKRHKRVIIAAARATAFAS